MSKRWKALAVAGVIGMLPLQAYAQTATPAAPARDPIAPLPQTTTPPPTAAEPAPEPSPLDLPPPLWEVADAQELLAFINSIGAEGLDPLEFDPAGLVEAMRSGDPTLLSKAATDRFYQLSSDLALGHVRRKDRQGWFVVDKDLDEARQRQLLEAAVATQRVATILQSLLPTHPQYGALKNALAMADKADSAKINRIRLNMDRWRWLPRELGQKYIIVNVPAFYATLVENGATRWKQKAIAGALKTPTPQVSAQATGVILNPWWEVPKSIEGEVRGKNGYVAVKGKDGKVQRWRQPPGPTNALGQMKFVMPNSEAIFLHDTNARSRFNSQVRALSHGCIRTYKIHDLAAELGSDDGGKWNRQAIDAAIATGKTIPVKFVKPVPVYIVYFSSAALNDGTIVDYPDLYNRDGKVLQALLDTRPKPSTQTAAR